LKTLHNKHFLTLLLTEKFAGLIQRKRKNEQQYTTNKDVRDMTEMKGMLVQEYE